MYQIDNDTAVSSQPASSSAGTPGYFSDGNPALGQAATILPAEFMNMLMMEMLGVLSAGNVTPSKTNFTQLATAIKAIISGQSTPRKYSGTGAGWSASTTLLASAAGTWGSISTAGITITLPAVSAVPAGTTIMVQNRSTGVATITSPNSIITTSAATSVSIGAGEWFELTANSPTSYWYVNVRGKLDESATLNQLAALGVGTANGVLVADCNAVQSGGLYATSTGSTVNTPIAVNGMLVHAPWNSNAAALQIWGSTSSARIFWRGKTTNNWMNWNELPSLTQVQGGSITYGIDTGAANAYVVAFTPVITARTEGQVLKFKANVSNTGACTINDGVSAVPLVGGAHAALQGGEIVAGGDCLVQWNSTVGTGSYVLLLCGGGAEQVAAATKSNHAMRLGQATGRLIGVQVLTATGVYTPTSGALTARITVIGAGAAGGTAGATSSGSVAAAGGGGAGGVGQSLVTVASISGTTATIGSAGAPSSSGGGGSGGASTFGGITASGGVGGALCGPLAPPQAGLGGAGGTATGGNIFNARGGAGMHGNAPSTSYVLSGSGGSNGYGGGGPGNLLATATYAAGVLGVGYGAGGGGGCSNSGGALASGASGTPGVVIIEEYS